MLLLLLISSGLARIEDCTIIIYRVPHDFCLFRPLSARCSQISDMNRKLTQLASTIIRRSLIVLSMNGRGSRREATLND